jgi:hypothetical protein
MANRNVTVKQGQTVFDIVSQEYGDTNSLHDFLELNGFNLNHNLRAADIVIVDTEGVGKQENKDFFNRRNALNKKKNVAANYTEYSARDFSSTHFNSSDFS